MNKTHSFRRGFTLIELLVVISIIGMLSSVVLISLQGARDKGNIAAGHAFNTSARSGLSARSAGSLPVAYFDFNGASVVGGVITNLRNQGSAVGVAGGGAAITFPADTTLHNSGNYLNRMTAGWDFSWTATNGAPIFDALLSKNFTYTLWYKPNGNTCFNAQCALITDSTDFNNTGILIDSTGVIVSHLFGLDVPNLTYATGNKNQWVHIALSVKSISATAVSISLYANGKQVAANTSYTHSTTINASNSIYVGGTAGNFFVPNSLYDDVAFYDSTLLASDIQNIYAAGLPAHMVAAK